MKVSFIIVAYNEGNTLGDLFNDLKKQDYNHKSIEVILVDGNSRDNTKEVMKKFSEENKGFDKVLVLDNPKRTLPCGWNVALKNSTGDLILRVDGHSAIPSNFISNNVRCIESGEDICGGYRPNIIDEETKWKRMLLTAESSMFGSSIAPYRRNSEKRYVNSVFHGAYLKRVFDKVGYYNEKLTRTEDNEMHYRMRAAGYKICFDPDIISYQHTRNTLKKMIKQKYLNGYWIGRTLEVCKKCFSIYHFVPLLFVISLIASSVLAIFGYWGILLIILISYTIVNLIISICTMIKEKFNVYNLLLPLIFLSLHLSYGIGTLKGILDTKLKR